MRKLVLGLVITAALVTLAACGDDSGVSADNAAADTAESTSPAATTTEPETTTSIVTETSGTPVTTVPPTDAPTTTAAVTVPPTDAPTTTGAEDGDVACGTLDPLLPTANVVSTGTADWAGDSSSADVTVYETEAGNRDFRLRVEGAGGGSEVALIIDPVAAPSYLGPVQVDFSLGSADPQPQELVVVVGTNSAGYNLGVFYRDDTGCLARFNGADGSPLELPIHASVGSASGLACDGGAGSQFIVRTTATASAGSGEYDVHDIKLRRDGDQLVDDVDIPGFIVDDGTPTSPLLRYTSITNCGF